MEAAVWLQPDDSVGEARQGDVVLTPAGSVVRVAEVDAQGALNVRAEVAPQLLPGLPQVGSSAERIEDEALLRAVRGVMAAERERGG